VLSQAEVDKRKEDFEYWLFEMDNALDRFLHGIDEPTRCQLDFSPGSLNAREAWVLERYASPDDLMKPEAKQVLDCVARYIGEIYLISTGRTQLPRGCHTAPVIDLTSGGGEEIRADGILISDAHAPERFVVQTIPTSGPGHGGNAPNAASGPRTVPSDPRPSRPGSRS